MKIKKKINAFIKENFRCLFLEGILDAKILKRIYNQQEKQTGLTKSNVPPPATRFV